MDDLKNGQALNILSLEEEVGSLLRAGRNTLALAESCTGGLVSHRLTNIPGSSDYFICGFVTYSDSTKKTVLGVGQDLLARYGAVSAPVVKAMARGAKRLAGADFALALSGVAGPTGGSREKPVGLVYIALESPAGTKVAEYRFQGERAAVKNQSAREALLMLKGALLEGG